MAAVRRSVQTNPEGDMADPGSQPSSRGISGALPVTSALLAVPGLVVVAVPPRPLLTPVAASASTVPGTSCPMFPANNWWHADISRLPRNRMSAAWLGRMGRPAVGFTQTSARPGEQPVPYGIPITVVRRAPTVPVVFEYADESDRVGYP